MHKINTHIIGKAEITPLNFCGKEIGFEIHSEGGFYTLPYEVKPTVGEHDFNTCKDCQKNIKLLTIQFIEKFNGNDKKNGFPRCCSYHSNLKRVKEFNRDDFMKVPEMVARKITFTIQHIINYKSSENAYKEITDYIEYVSQSFGEMPKDCGEPFLLSSYYYHVIDNINKQVQAKYLYPALSENLLKFIHSCQTAFKNETTDFNILIGTYQKWLDIFPFDLNSYFGNLKQQFENKLLILNGKPEVNIYSGMTKAKMHTKISLIEALINLTNDLLMQINGVALYEKGLITDSNKIKLELVISSRKLKLKQGYKKNSLDAEQQYRKILKEWLNDEKVFIDEITPLLYALPPLQNVTKTDKLKSELGKSGFFELPKVKQLSDPNKQNLIELISKNGLPYSIAMFDFLGFLEHLRNQYFKSKYKLNKEISKWFNSDKDGRAVKGNISTLSTITNEDKKKYTAHTHKETVQADYQKLK